MKNDRSSVEQTPTTPKVRTGIRGAWDAFWFTPVDPIGLHVVRVLSGLLLLGWFLTYWGQQEAFFGLSGWFDRQAYLEASRLPEEPPTPIGWSIFYLTGTNPNLLNPLFYSAIGVVFLFTLGVWTRVTSILTWVATVSFLANPAIGYDADSLLVILAFYLMIGYVLLGQWSRPQSIAGRLLGNRDALILAPFLWRNQGKPRVGSYAANIALRLLQIHFAIVVVTSGLHKLQFAEYWGGVALWFPLNPALEVTQETLRRQAADAPMRFFVLSLAQYITLAWQITFPLFAWRPRWQAVLLAGAVVGWLGSVFVYRLPLFGPLYFVACLSYLTTAKWLGNSSAVSRKLKAARTPSEQPTDKAGKGRPHRLKTH
jgi:hypothetical protein